MSAYKLCPRCGSRCPDAPDYSGSPIRVCPRCGQEYFDKDIREPAFYEPPKRTWEWLKFLLPVLLPASILWIVTAIRLALANGARALWPLLFPIPVILGGIPAFWIYKRESRQFKAAKAAYSASAQRLQDKAYILRLLDYGYSVPRHFLSDFHPDLLGYTSDTTPRTEDGRIFYFAD